MRGIQTWLPTVTVLRAHNSPAVINNFVLSLPPRAPTPPGVTSTLSRRDRPPSPGQGRGRGGAAGRAARAQSTTEARGPSCPARSSVALGKSQRTAGGANSRARRPGRPRTNCRTHWESNFQTRRPQGTGVPAFSIFKTEGVPKDFPLLLSPSERRLYTSLSDETRRGARTERLAPQQKTSALTYIKSNVFFFFLVFNAAAGKRAVRADALGN